MRTNAGNSFTPKSTARLNASKRADLARLLLADPQARALRDQLQGLSKRLEALGETAPPPELRELVLRQLPAVTAPTTRRWQSRPWRVAALIAGLLTAGSIVYQVAGGPGSHKRDRGYAGVRRLGNRRFRSFGLRTCYRPRKPVSRQDWARSCPGSVRRGARRRARNRLRTLAGDQWPGKREPWGAGAPDCPAGDRGRAAGGHRADILGQGAPRGPCDAARPATPLSANFLQDRLYVEQTEPTSEAQEANA